MSGPRQFRQIQGPHSHSLGERLYERLQQTILDKTGVACTVLVKPGVVSIRTESYPDFVLAMSAIKGQTNEKIVWDQPEGSK